MSIRPEPLRRESADQVTRTVGVLLGGRLERVVYAMPCGVDWSADPDTPFIHQVDLAVVLSLGDHRLRVDWAQSGLDEGLALQVDSATPGTWSSVSAETGAAWAPFHQSVLRDVAVVWHRPEAEAAEVALAVTLEFDGGLSVTIALGTCGAQEGLAYMPDELVVLFKRDAAVDYLTPLSTGRSSVGGDDAPHSKTPGKRPP